MPTSVAVSASCRDQTGGSDAAYDLCGTWELDEFLDLLRQTLLTDWGLTHAKGDVALHLEITTPRQWQPCSEGPFDTREQALYFAIAEIGVHWRLVEKGGKTYIDVAESEE